MKEATGELNMTVITVLVIVALGIIGTTVVLPAIQGGLKQNAACSAAACEACGVGDKTTKCQYYNDEKSTPGYEEITCPCSFVE